MVAQFRTLQSFLLTHLLYLDEVRQGAYLLFHRFQTNQLIQLLIGVTLHGLVHRHTVFLCSPFGTVLTVAELVFPTADIAAAVVTTVNSDIFLTAAFRFVSDYHREDT